MFNLLLKLDTIEEEKYEKNSLKTIFALICFDCINIICFEIEGLKSEEYLKINS